MSAISEIKKNPYIEQWEEETDPKKRNILVKKIELWMYEQRIDSLNKVDKKRAEIRRKTPNQAKQFGQNFEEITSPINRETALITAFTAFYNEQRDLSTKKINQLKKEIAALKNI